MSQTYITRSLEPVLKKAAAEFPAVVLTGPRQSGKTTLFQHLFGKCCNYVSLVKMFQKDFGDKVLGGYVVHPGDITLSLGSGVTALPFSEL